MCVCKLTSSHLGVLCCRSVRYDALDLEELVGLVSADDGEAEPHGALLQRSGQEAALQLGGVPRERRLLCVCQRVNKPTHTHTHTHTWTPQINRERTRT